ncbi:MAG: hypothetical protein ACJ77K_06930 [Bacteroidia bacterium]
MKTKLIIAALLIFSTTISANNRPYTQKFYTKLVEDGEFLSVWQGLFNDYYTEYELKSDFGKHDSLVSSFRPELLNDSIEPKYVDVESYAMVVDTLDPTKLFPENSRVFRQKLLVGFRFKHTNNWIPLSDSALTIQYLKNQSLKACAEYRKLFKNDGEGLLCFGGAILAIDTGLTLLYGPLAWTYGLPLMVTTSIVGSAIALPSGFYYLKHNEEYASQETAKQYNKSLGTQ